VVSEGRANLPAAFRPAGIVRMGRLTIARYVSPRPVMLWLHQLATLKTGYGATNVVLDGPPASRLYLGENAKTAPSFEVSRARAVAG
jgi:hypothetical protein